MTEVLSTNNNVSKRVPWSKGKVVGAKPPLRPKHVWSVRTKIASRTSGPGPCSLHDKRSTTT